MAKPRPLLRVADWWRRQTGSRGGPARGPVPASGRVRGAERALPPEDRKGGGAPAAARARNARGAGGADRWQPVRHRNGVPAERAEQGSGRTAAMNTVLSRANSLFAFSLSVMAALTFGCFITTAFKDRSVPVRLHVSRIML